MEKYNASLNPQASAMSTLYWTARNRARCYRSEHRKQSRRRCPLSRGEPMNVSLVCIVPLTMGLTDDGAPSEKSEAPSARHTEGENSRPAVSWTVSSVSCAYCFSYFPAAASSLEVRPCMPKQNAYRSIDSFSL